MIKGEDLDQTGRERMIFYVVTSQTHNELHMIKGEDLDQTGRERMIFCVFPSHTNKKTTNDKE